MLQLVYKASEHFFSLFSEVFLEGFVTVLLVNGLMFSLQSLALVRLVVFAKLEGNGYLLYLCFV